VHIKLSQENPYLRQGITDKKFLSRPVLPQNVCTSCSRNINRISNWKRKHVQHCM